MIVCDFGEAARLCLTRILSLFIWSQGGEDIVILSCVFLGSIHNPSRPR